MRKFLTFLLLIGIVLIGIAGFFYYKINSPLFQKEHGLVITEKDTPYLVFHALKNKGITSSELYPIYLAKLKKASKLKEGYYLFKKGTSANELVNKLRAGRQTPIKLMFNNVRTFADFAGKIARQIRPDSIELLEHFSNNETAANYGFDDENYIGMFLPNTYEIYYTATPQEFTDRMHKEYQRFWTIERKQKAENLGYSPQQVSALAAIVDEETNKNDEKKRIAGVYLNRLARNIPLQADPTLKFAAGDFTIKRLLNKHMTINSPYNTYKNAGLPPGPIRQPSMSAIDAVLNAEKHNYLYFCAKADFSGYHIFAKTLAEHNRNAAAYHRELNRRGIR